MDGALVSSGQASPQAVRPSLIRLGTPQAQLAGLAVKIKIEENDGAQHGHQEKHFSGKENNLQPDVFQRTLELNFRHYFCFVFVQMMLMLCVDGACDDDAGADAQTVGVYMDSLRMEYYNQRGMTNFIRCKVGGKGREGYKAVRK